MTAQLNKSRLNSARLNNTSDYPYSFEQEMRRRRGSNPVTKIEFIDPDGTETDISRYFIEGANLQHVKERAVDEIQAGEFDVVLANDDGKFSEYKPWSLLYGVQYHGAKIRISQGFILPNGVTEYRTQGVGFIDSLVADGSQSIVTFRCRDLLRRIMDQKLHGRPEDEVPVMDPDNNGNGKISAIATKPFKTKNEAWVLTCNLQGQNNVATFTVVGSVSGNVGTATSGVEFSTGSGAGGIKFKINASTNDWMVGDEITFTTSRFPEWTETNAAKIAWSILTGYDWDTDTQEEFSALVLNLDHTKSSANTDINYDSFVDAIAALDSVGVFALTGYAAYDEDAVAMIQSLTTLFLGSLFSDGDGKIRIKSYVPVFGEAVTLFSHDRKTRVFGFTRSVEEIINSVSVRFKASDEWVFSDEEEELDGAYVKKNAASILSHNEIGKKLDFRWYNASDQHVQDVAAKILSKFEDPPANFDLITGLDALETEIGDIVRVRDAKHFLDDVPGEVTMIQKNFGAKPSAITMRVRRDSVIDRQFGFVGSEEDEGDGISPQADDFDLASDVDKIFAYFSEDGQGTPDYRIF